LAVPWISGGVFGAVDYRAYGISAAGETGGAVGLVDDIVFPVGLDLPAHKTLHYEADAPDFDTFRNVGWGPGM